MKVRFLGTHQGESLGAHPVSLLIDGALAVDAGSLAGLLTMAEQVQLRSVLVTHHHLDHVKDLPLLGFNRMQVQAPTLPIYTSDAVQRVVLSHLLNGVIWLNLTERPTPEMPALRFVTVEEGQEFGVLGYTVLPVATVHPIPTLGYQVTSPDGKSVFYTADTGPTAGVWERVAPDLLIAEVTMSNDQEEVAIRVGHLTASLLREELARFHSIHDYFPRVRAVHVNPFQEDGVREELAIVAQDLGVEIVVAEEGSEVEV